MSYIMRRLAFLLASVWVITSMALYTQANPVRQRPPMAQTLTSPPPLRQATTTDILPICQVLGDSLGFGVSLFSEAGTWIVDAHTQYGVDWRFGYFYTGHREHPLNEDSVWFLNRRLDQIESSGAIPVVTFYTMLEIGQEKFGGSEAEIVQQMLQDSTSMRDYFDNYIDLLDLLNTRATAGRPILLHVEPDPWGFMMWAMGVEGNSDAATVPVKVAASGHPEVQGFADHAGGLGQALVYLRNQHAPQVLLGWHASNDRVGTRPEVVVSFFSSMGKWDVLITDQPHMHQPDSGTPWWEPWDETLVNTNLNWYHTVTSGTGLPILIWQDTFGNDYHLIGNWAADKTMLTRLASAGVAGYMFEHLNKCGDTNVDDFRGRRRCTDAPGGQPSGRAKDYRARVLAYQNTPLRWPPNTPCSTLSAPSALRVTQARLHAATPAVTLTVTLQWTPPAQADTQELRFSNTLITDANWPSAQLLSNAIPGAASIYTASLPYTGGAYYFAARATLSGEQSALSNNAFWPDYDIYLPLIIRQ